MPTEWLIGLTQLPNAVAIPHGIEMMPLDSESPQLLGPPRIVFQGRLVTTKGLRVLLEAATILRAENRAFEILVIGDGPERGRCQELAEQLQLSTCVHFTGRVAVTDLAALFAKACIVVVPSLGGEVFGLVLAESMSRGLPVIVSNLGSFAEVVGDAGLTFRVGNPNDLARQITLLLGDSVLASALGGRARRRIFDKYSRRHMIDAHVQVYRQVGGTAPT